MCFQWSLVSVSHQLRARNPIITSLLASSHGASRYCETCWEKSQSTFFRWILCAILRASPDELAYWYKGSKAAWGNQLLSDWMWGFIEVNSHLVPQTSQNLVDEEILGPSREVIDVDLLKGHDAPV